METFELREDYLIDQDDGLKKLLTSQNIDILREFHCVIQQLSK